MNQVHEAIRAATEYLLTLQADDGHWEEYDLPVGRSDAWVTAYVGLALHAAGPGAAGAAAIASSGRAAAWLIESRPYAAGWGYNGRTGPDADSTAHAIALIRSAGFHPHRRDETWLLHRWQADGGFATYQGPGAWGAPHVDITPACYRALADPDRTRLRPEVVAYLHRHRLADGAWPAYWWRTHFYSTYACLALLRELDAGAAGRPAPMTRDHLRAIDSAFELALAAGIAALEPGRAALAHSLVEVLLRHQAPRGGWPGAKNLRVTDPACDRPWVQPMGVLYRDHSGLITTATALAVLARLPE